MDRGEIFVGGGWCLGWVSILVRCRRLVMIGVIVSSFFVVVVAAVAQERDWCIKK